MTVLYRIIGPLLVVALLMCISAKAGASLFPNPYEGPPIVRSEQSAIRIAHALMLAQWRKGPWAQNETEWAKKCTAILSRDGQVWYVRNKGAAGVAGPCTGNIVVGIGARDGRWLGYALF